MSDLTFKGMREDGVAHQEKLGVPLGQTTVGPDKNRKLGVGEVKGIAPDWNCLIPGCLVKCNYFNSNSGLLYATTNTMEKSLKRNLHQQIK